MQAPCVLANQSESCKVCSNASLVPSGLEVNILINKSLNLIVGRFNLRERLITIFFLERNLNSQDLFLDRSAIVPGNLGSQIFD